MIGNFFSKLSFYKNFHSAALFCAAILHGSIAIIAFSSSEIIVAKQQAIQISFAAPNTQKQQNKSNLNKKNIEDKSAINQKSKQSAEESSKQKEIARSQIERQTSGISDPNAVANKAIESDPVFDAAYLNNTPPIYPRRAKQAGIQGKVLLKVVVKIDGKPLNIAIISSSGSSILDEAALNAVKNWNFIPANHSGKPVQSSVIVPVEFKII